MFINQLSPDKKIKRKKANDRQRGDEIAIEPIFLLPFFKNELQRSNWNNQQENPDPINVFSGKFFLNSVGFLQIEA